MLLSFSNFLKKYIDPDEDAIKGIALMAGLKTEDISAILASEPIPLTRDEYCKLAKAIQPGEDFKNLFLFRLKESIRIEIEGAIEAASMNNQIDKIHQLGLTPEQSMDLIGSEINDILTPVPFNKQRARSTLKETLDAVLLLQTPLDARLVQLAKNLVPHGANPPGA